MDPLFGNFFSWGYLSPAYLRQRQDRKRKMGRVKSTAQTDIFQSGMALFPGWHDDDSLDTTNCDLRRHYFGGASYGDNESYGETFTGYFLSFPLSPGSHGHTYTQDAEGAIWTFSALSTSPRMVVAEEYY
jgi:hypothetical protein